MRKQRLEFFFLSQKKPEKRRLPFISSVEIQIPVSNINDHFPFRLAMIPDPLLYTNKDQPTSANIPSANSLSHPPVYDRAIEHQSKDKHARSKVCSFPRSPVHPLLPPAHLETRSRSAIKPFRGNDSFPNH